MRSDRRRGLRLPMEVLTSNGQEKWFTNECRLYYGEKSTVETIQVVLDTKLLKAADAAAKRQKQNRSALIRYALQEHLKRLQELELEERDRLGYLAHPQRTDSNHLWENTASWPED